MAMVTQHHASYRRAIYLSRQNCWLDQSASPQLQLHWTGQRRSIMSHRGPMENTCRSGKRKMTGAISPATQPATLWHFEVLGGNTFQWEPPTTAVERRVRARQWTPSKLYNNFLSWLENPDGPKPFLSPSTDQSSIDQSTTGQSPIGQSPTDQSITHPSITNQSIGTDARKSQGLSEAANDFRRKTCTLTLEDWAEAEEICRDYCGVIADEIIADQISAQDMISAIQPFDSPSHVVIQEKGPTHMLLAMLRSSMVLAFIRTEQNLPGAIPGQFWVAMLTHLSAAYDNRYQHLFPFQKLLIYMPKAHRSNISDQMLFDYFMELIYTQATRRNLISGWITLCRHAGRALAELSTEQLRALSHSLADYIERPDVEFELKFRCRFIWLLLQAYSSKTNHEVFVHEYKNFRETAAVDGFRTWLLTVARLHATKLISIKAHALIIGRGLEHYGHQRQDWVAVVTGLLLRRDHERAIASLCDLLTDMGESRILIVSLATTQLGSASDATLRSVIRFCNKLDISLALRICLSDCDENELLLQPWRSSAREEHLATIMAYPKAESHMWQALEIDRGNKKTKMELIDILSTMYINFPGLSKSQRMRRLMRASYCQQLISGKVSHTVIRNSVDVMTADLAEGLWGRDRLLALVTKLVHDFVSPEQAREMQSRLDAWKELIESAKAARSMETPPYRSSQREEPFSGYDDVKQEMDDEQSEAVSSASEQNRPS